MMCDPCFMDANQVGFVHELTWEEIKKMLDNAITIKPRRQMSVQFSGGEPTLSPYFLDAVRYARKVGYNSVQAATNGIEFAKSFEFAQQDRKSTRLNSSHLVISYAVFCLKKKKKIKIIYTILQDLNFERLLSTHTTEVLVPNIGHIAELISDYLPCQYLRQIISRHSAVSV